MPGLGGRIVADGGRPQQQQQQRQQQQRRSAAGGSTPPARPQTVVLKTKLVKNVCHLHKDSVRLTRMEPLDGARCVWHGHVSVIWLVPARATHGVSQPPGRSS
jgi:hypothetical protein